jgi:hypothetical protein
MRVVILMMRFIELGNPAGRGLTLLESGIYRETHLTYTVNKPQSFTYEEKVHLL